MLACGSAKLNSQMNTDAFQSQERLVPPIAGFILLILSGYPRLTRRVEAASAWHRSQMGNAPTRAALSEGGGAKPQFF